MDAVLQAVERDKPNLFTPGLRENIVHAGIRSADQVVRATEEILLEIPGIDAHKARVLNNYARRAAFSHLGLQYNYDLPDIEVPKEPEAKEMAFEVLTAADFEEDQYFELGSTSGSDGEDYPSESDDDGIDEIDSEYEMVEVEWYE
ncbi:hypothetical protein BDN72DRAFT_907073 [Pluteus cervinus]|uniref:Uncharacterized protein n=1 Tax=Pluteus cervinus TaxID=181527 RepID=A0ACD2ZXR7_9AGAR|nr:hypothetical protein BDN72DRAFT_907073 [Pluteus cervinus]